MGGFFHVSFPRFFTFVEKSRVNYAFLQFFLRKPQLSSLYPREGNIKFVYLDKPTFIWQSNATSWVEAGSRGLGEENIAGFSRAGEESNRAISMGL